MLCVFAGCLRKCRKECRNVIEVIVTTKAALNKFRHMLDFLKEESLEFNGNPPLLQRLQK